jgi:hypothetical protein
MDQPVIEINELLFEIAMDELDADPVKTENGFISINALRIVEQQERARSNLCPKCGDKYGGRMTKNGCNFCGWGD